MGKVMAAARAGFFRLALLASVVGSIAHAAAGGTTEKVDLIDLLGRAANTQIDWLQAKTELQKAQLGRTASRSTFLPDIKLHSQFAYDWQTARRDQESFASSAGIRSDWNLYDSGRSWRLFRAADLAVERAQIAELQARDRVTFEVLSRYSRAWIALRQRQITEQRLKLLKGQFNLTARQFRQGLKARRDYQRLEAETKRAQLSLERQANLVNTALEELTRYVGENSPLDWNALSPFNGEAIYAGLVRRFSPAPSERALNFRLAKVDAEKARIELDDSRTRLWPELTLSLGVGYGMDQFAGNNQAWGDRDRWSADAGIGLTWMLWDWGGRRSSAEQSLLTTKFQERGLEQARLDHHSRQEQLKREVERLKKSVALAREIYAIELKTFNDIEAEYREGRASYLDLISSLDRRTSAELELEEELHQSVLTVADVLLLTGDLYAAIIGH